MATCGNPLLLQWVGEWLEEARLQNSKRASVYKKAHDSIKACSAIFQHPSEASRLQGVGDVICKRLTDRMVKHCEENGLPPPMKARQQAVAQDVGEGVSKKPRKAKDYVPKYRSGGYALILALSKLREDEEIAKTVLMERAQIYSDASFTTPSDPKSFYTAWNTMTTLIKHDLVSEKGRPTKRYALTEEGWACARSILKTGNHDEGGLDVFVRKSQSPDRGQENMDSSGHDRISPSREQSKGRTNNIIPLGESLSTESSLPHVTPASLPPGSFTIELILDIREVFDKKHRDYMQNELTKAGIVPIMRALDIGDTLWVAKVKDPEVLRSIGGGGDEVMLDYIVERKRLTDLIGSIRDGRFNEQKFRLKRSGTKNVIYIIEENMLSQEAWKGMEEAVKSAISSAQVVEGFFIKKTQTMDETIRYLARMTRLLKQTYEAKPLYIIPTAPLTMQNYLPILKDLTRRYPDRACHISYDAFASMASKSETMTLRDVYLKMLMSTRGVTGEKAVEIQKRWKTPAAFLDAYAALDKDAQSAKRKNEMVADALMDLQGRKKIAKILSAKIADVWGSQEST